MLNTTFNKAKQAGACIESYRKMAQALGGVKEYGADTPIALSKVMEVCGLEDAIWSFRCTLELSDKILIEFARQCEERVLVNFEKLFPEDRRPRLAIQAARDLSAGKISWSAARSAVRSAFRSAFRSAESAAWSAVRSAARSAESAEREWQTKTFLECLGFTSKEELENKDD